MDTTYSLRVGEMTEDEIREELVVHQVFLDSMVEGAWDGIEQERIEIMTNIRQLRKKLDELHPHHNGFHSSDSQSQAPLNHSTGQPHSQPAGTRESTMAMSSPNRKRTFQQANLYEVVEPNRSRRPDTRLRDNDPEIIDLTCDNVKVESTPSRGLNGSGRYTGVMPSRIANPGEPARAYWSSSTSSTRGRARSAETAENPMPGALGSNRTNPGTRSGTTISISNSSARNASQVADGQAFGTSGLFSGLGSGSTIQPLRRRSGRYGIGHTAASSPGDRRDQSRRFSRRAHIFGIDSAATEQELGHLLANIHPDLNGAELNPQASPEGLQHPLYPHQLVALSWMKQMEMSESRGGILADDMGLGKTISALALILARPPDTPPPRRPTSDQKVHRKTNLIVGPLSLLQQWGEEINNKIKLSHKLTVFLYHGKKEPIETLLSYDVVVTTYGTLAQEFKHYEQFIEASKGRNIDFHDKSYAAQFPLLHRTKARFRRVILDEAQCIKNRKTKTAKACHLLNTRYRWCLTGTPIMNGVEELYSLVKFLRIRPYNKFEKFRQAFGLLFGQKGDAKCVAMKKFRALLKAIMLRRKKDSELNGEPILRLPPKREHVEYANLSGDESDYYKQLEEKSQVVFSKYLREGSVGKNYSHILVLLLRLRQACCHPHLNMDVEDAANALDDATVEALVTQLDKTTVERIKSMEAFECPICYDAVQSPLFLIPCGHDSCTGCVTRVVDNAASQSLRQGVESSGARCPVCRGPFKSSECFSYEQFKRIHMPETEGWAESTLYVGSSGEDGNSEESEDEYACSGVDREANLADSLDDDEDELPPLQVLIGKALAAKGQEKIQTTKNVKKDISKGKAKAKERGKGKGKDKDMGKGKGKGKKRSDVKPSMLKGLRLEAGKNREAYGRYMAYLQKTWMPAAKVTKCMGLLRQFQETGHKTIVFSQWTLLLDLLQVAMWRENFANEPLRYDGSMSGKQRNLAATEFRDKLEVKVMLVSLRAGNAGLNLTAASRVIIMDPFWNPYIEMQAIDRTYRIGQRREVEVYRILTEKTVEDRIVKLQQKKKEIVDAALDETESMKIGRLSNEELTFLFNAF